MINSDEVLRVSNLEKVYSLSKGVQTKALHEVSLSMHKGEFVALMGPSGSGKSTLLNCISTIDKPTSGDITIAGKDITKLKGKALAQFRRESLGFIFQDSHLIDTLSCYENIALPLNLEGEKPAKAQERIGEIADFLEIDTLLAKFPYQLSGGQQQRVCAARALIANPSLILADEPTGALDSSAAEKLLTLLKKINNQGSSILMVTHDPMAASYASRCLFLKDGSIVEDLSNNGEGFYEAIMQCCAQLAQKGVAHKEDLDDERKAIEA